MRTRARVLRPACLSTLVNAIITNFTIEPALRGNPYDIQYQWGAMERFEEQRKVRALFENFTTTTDVALLLEMPY